MIAPYAYVDTSALGATELIRACRRALSKKQLTQVEDVLGAVVLMDVTPAILARAAELAPRELRTLDAIHLATALSASDTSLDFITCDARLAQAARAHGFTVHAP